MVNESNLLLFSYSFLGFFGSMALMAVLNILTWFGYWVWAWIDDSSLPKNSPFTVLVKKFVFAVLPKCVTEDIGDVPDVYVCFLLTLALVLIIVNVVYLFPIFSLCVVIGIGMMHLSRFARRIYKNLNNHIEQKDIHTQ